jgi:hypothetical protein
VKRYGVALVGVLLSPLTVFLGLLVSGAGHGSRVGYALVLPSAIVAGWMFDDSEVAVLAIAALQTPLYAVILQLGVRGDRVRSCLLLVALLHTALFACALWLPT